RRYDHRGEGGQRPGFDGDHLQGPRRRSGEAEHRRRPAHPSGGQDRGAAQGSGGLIGMYPHRIRLRGPWECEPVAGRARFPPPFGYPGRIDAHERVWLTFAGADRARVSLNGVVLSEHAGPGAFEFEVTALLQARNELAVEVEGEHGGRYGEV